MGKRKPRPPKKQRAFRKRAPGAGASLRSLLAFLLLFAFLGAVFLLVRRPGFKPPKDVERLEGELRRVLARVGVEDASFERQGSTLVVRVFAKKGFPTQRFALELEAALHNAGGQLSRLPVLEAGGYGEAGFQGQLGEAGLRVLVVREAPSPPAPRGRPALPRGLGKLAIVLDDAGYSLEALPLIEKLPREVAVAVLPNAPNASAVARALREQGRELLLHMPMEPEDNGASHPGEGALRPGMGEEEVRRLLDEALGVVGPVAGVNNHMGSKATSNEPLMKAWAAALVGRGLYFLDSRTTPASVAKRLVAARGVPTLGRDVFLDVVEEEQSIRSALATATSLARSKGEAVAIGHVHPLTLRVLLQELPKLRDVQLVRPSELLPKP